MNDSKATFQVRTTKELKSKLEQVKGGKNKSYHQLMEFLLAVLELKSLKGSQKAEILLLKWLKLTPKGEELEITQTRIYNSMGGSVNVNSIKKVMESYKTEIEIFNNKL